MKNKDTLYLIDDSFSHAPSSSWYNHPKFFNWVRSTNSDTLVTTKLDIINLYSDKKIYGWIIEPPEINRAPYEFAKNNFEKFVKIFTYDNNLLSISNKFELVPPGGCWIEEVDRLISTKKKLCSTIVSSKRTTTGHRFRHEVVPEARNVDVFGAEHIPLNKKIDGIKDYMFSVVIENQKMDFLFTEKLIDCFVTGTIPIYWGCPSIENFFDKEGIITFDSVSELKHIISNINEELYFKMLNSVNNNFELAKKYLIADDLIYQNIKKNNET